MVKKTDTKDTTVAAIDTLNQEVQTLRKSPLIGNVKRIAIYQHCEQILESLRGAASLLPRTYLEPIRALPAGVKLEKNVLRLTLDSAAGEFYITFNDVAPWMVEDNQLDIVLEQLPLLCERAAEVFRQYNVEVANLKAFYGKAE